MFDELSVKFPVAYNEEELEVLLDETIEELDEEERDFSANKYTELLPVASLFRYCSVLYFAIKAFVLMKFVKSKTRIEAIILALKNLNLIENSLIKANNNKMAINPMNILTRTRSFDKENTSIYIFMRYPAEASMTKVKAIRRIDMMRTIIPDMLFLRVNRTLSITKTKFMEAIATS